MTKIMRETVSHKHMLLMKNAPQTKHKVNWVEFFGEGKTQDGWLDDFLESITTFATDKKHKFVPEVRIIPYVTRSIRVQTLYIISLEENSGAGRSMWC